MCKIKKEVFRGLSALPAFLLIVATFGSSIANSYAGRINTVRGISTSKAVQGEASKHGHELLQERLRNGYLRCGGP